MTTIPKSARRPKTDPLAAPIADQASAPVGELQGMSNNLPRPSASAVAEFEDSLRQREGFLDRIDALVDASTRAVATDEETAGRCADLTRQIAAAGKVVEDTRKFVKEPYFEAGRAVDDAARNYSGRLTGALMKVKGLLEAHAREQMRIQREREEAERRAEDARRRAEEEARAAAVEKGEPEPEPEPAPPPPPRPAAPAFQARGDYGSTASAVKVWKGEIEDLSKAFKAVSGNEAVREAIQKAVNQRIKAGDRKIPGVRVFEDVGVRVR